MFRQAPAFPYHELGIVEDGNTASRAISKDAYVIWKGASYFASTDILQGATLEEDVNLTAIPDGVINGVVSALNNNITMPDYSNVLEEVPYTTNASYTYTATENCIFFGCFALATNNSGKIKVTVNGKNLIYPTNHPGNTSEWFYSQVSAYTTFMAYVPLKKGDVMVITANTVYGNFWGNIFGCT